MLSIRGTLGRMVGWIYIGLLVIALPCLALRSARALARPREELPARSTLHFNTLAMLIVLLGVAVAVARKEGMVILPAWSPGWTDAAAIAGLLVVSLGMLAARIGRVSARQQERLELITMTDWRDVRQLTLYATVCAAAGVAEEVAYRGVLMQALEVRTGSTITSAVIASLAFGAAHSVQGWTGVALASAFAGMFHIVVHATGDLYAAMIGHAVYDLIAGIAISECCRRRRARSANLSSTG